MASGACTRGDSTRRRSRSSRSAICAASCPPAHPAVRPHAPDALRRICIEEDFNPRLGKNHRPDVAAFHHHIRPIRHALLLGNHRAPHRTDRRNPRRASGNFRRANGIAHIIAVQVHTTARQQFNIGGQCELLQTMRVIERDTFADRPQRTARYIAPLSI